jgi:hypothetical protein
MNNQTPPVIQATVLPVRPLAIGERIQNLFIDPHTKLVRWPLPTVIAVIVLFIVATALFSGGYNMQTMAGNYRVKGPLQVRLILGKDGTCSFGDFRGQWEVRNGAISLSLEGMNPDILSITDKGETLRGSSGLVFIRTHP